MRIPTNASKAESMFTRLSYRHFTLLAGWLLVAVLPAQAISAASTTSDAEPVGSLVLVESVPVETSLDLAELPEAPAVWLEMVRSARRSIDIETFYFSQRPDGPCSLALILDAVEDAAGRGVRIRALSDAGFNHTYPEISARLGNLPGAESRLLDARDLWGGVQHAKCFLVDAEEFFLGSQNWDWRALEHIHELGVRVRHPSLAAKLQSIFRLDWSLATGEAAAASKAEPGDEPDPARLLYRGEPVSATLAASPPEALPAGVPWDEPLLVALMDRARRTLRLQLLSYNPVDRDGGYYGVLDNALRRAAARGVQVKIVLANWAKRHYMLPHIQSLAAVPNLEISFTNLPPWSGGFVPYARVEHAKYLVADEDACWIGTANWSRNYFHGSRNISLFLTGAAVATDVIAFFEQSWHSSYAEIVDPCGRYEPPRIGR